MKQVNMPFRELSAGIFSIKLEFLNPSGGSASHYFTAAVDRMRIQDAWHWLR